MTQVVVGSPVHAARRSIIAKTKSPRQRPARQPPPRLVEAVEGRCLRLVEIGRVDRKTPRYQLIAAEAARLHQAGQTFKAIAERFGIDDHTAAKAVRWFRRR